MKKYINALNWRVRKFFKIKNLNIKIKNSKIKDLRLHFGCGSNPLKGYINVDYQFSKNIDLSEDLNNPKIFPKDSTKEIFSNAFFEHLYKSNRITHLLQCYTILNGKGTICYIGLPYFTEIAKLYLNREIDFNLYNVYRYTHGDPETDGKDGDSSWLAQLHKSIFDEYEIKNLLKTAGFESYLIFKYCYPGEEGYSVNIGFYAVKGISINSIEDSCINYLRKFDKEKILIDTLEFLK